MTVQMLRGDCVEMLRTMAAGSAQTCVTSPPYFGLRDYGLPPTEWPEVRYAPMPGLPEIVVPAQACCLGLESSAADFIGHMVLVFREVHRVLRDDGTLWLNLGDSYAASGTTRWPNTGDGYGNGYGKHGAWHGGEKLRPAAGGLAPKNLLGIPWRVAFALQDDGWFLRQDIIWHKPNPMPESVRDRCTKAHEYLFLLSKAERYYFDLEAMREPAASDNRRPVMGAPVPGKPLQSRGRAAGNKSHKYVEAVSAGAEEHRTKAGLLSIADAAYDTRNRRSVWTVATRPYRGAHFATFPPSLIEPCVLAGSRLGDTVLDPFGGSGTTAAVAVKHGRDAVLCELNPDYLGLAAERIAEAEAEAAIPRTGSLFEQGALA